MLQLTERSTFPESRDLNTCCGAQTHLRETRLAVADMPNPPRTADRWAIVTHWQCHRREDHSGEVWATTDNPDTPLRHR